jgi:osmotically-inducible protein OsmY
VDSTQVDVTVHDGVVTLTGTVPSLMEKRAAGDDAWDTSGVVDVHNDLTIAP